MQGNARQKRGALLSPFLLPGRQNKAAFFQHGSQFFRQCRAGLKKRGERVQHRREHGPALGNAGKGF